MLLVIFVLTWGEVAVKRAIDNFTNGLLPSFAAAERDGLERPDRAGLHNLVTRVPPVTPAPAPYAAVYTLNWLSSAGTACFLAAIASAIVLACQPASLRRRVHRRRSRQLAKPMLTIASMLALAYLMNYSGMTSTLGIALAATGSTFPFFSAILGWLGVFLTGSDTSANALFGNLQMITANQIGLNPVLTASVNSAAGVMGKMIALPSIAVAVAATGLTSRTRASCFASPSGTASSSPASSGSSRCCSPTCFRPWCRCCRRNSRAQAPAQSPLRIIAAIRAGYSGK